MKFLNLFHPKYCVTISTADGDMVATFHSQKKMQAVLADIIDNANANITIFQHAKQGIYDCIDIIPKTPKTIGFR